MLNKIYIHYITTLFVLESFIISCWLLKGKKKSVSESESASLLEKNRYRNRPRKIMIGASLLLTLHAGSGQPEGLCNLSVCRSDAVRDCGNSHTGGLDAVCLFKLLLRLCLCLSVKKSHAETLQPLGCRVDSSDPLAHRSIATQASAKISLL